MNSKKVRTKRSAMPPTGDKPDKRIEYFLEPIGPDSVAANKVLAMRIGDPEENALQDVLDQRDGRHNVWRCKTRELLVEIWGGTQSTKVKFKAWTRFGSWNKLREIPGELVDHWVGGKPKARNALIVPQAQLHP